MSLEKRGLRQQLVTRPNLQLEAEVASYKKHNDDLKPSAGVETRQLSEEGTRLSHRGRAEPLQLYECKRNKRPVVQIEACNSGLGPS